jgi:hypothetical protein
MIKDMRRELASCQQDSWRLDEVAELGDMKERLMMSMLPAIALDGSEVDGSEDGLPAGSVASGFAALSALNDEMDDELEALMQQLGSVKSQFSSLEAQRRDLEVRTPPVTESVHRIITGGMYGIPSILDDAV